MKRLVLLSVIMLAVVSVALPAADMTGLITCSKCRHTDVKDMNCAANCLRNGVPAVFYDQATQKFYKVANQDVVKPHFGKRVVVTGNVDGDTLTVTAVKAAPPAGK